MSWKRIQESRVARFAFFTTVGLILYYWLAGILLSVIGVPVEANLAVAQLNNDPVAYSWFRTNGALIAGAVVFLTLQAIPFFKKPKVKETPDVTEIPSS